MAVFDAARASFCPLDVLLRVIRDLPRSIEYLR
jgi:hypothetical protein